MYAFSNTKVTYNSDNYDCETKHIKLTELHNGKEPSGNKLNYKGN